MSHTRDAKILCRNQAQPSSNSSAETLIPQKSHRTRSSSSSDEKYTPQQSLVEEVSTHQRPPSLGLVVRYAMFMPLIVTTVISSLLLAGSVLCWTVPKDVYDIIVVYRATTQLVVQVIANSLGLVHVAVMCTLINYSTRLRLASVPTSLDALRFWNSLLSRQCDWTLPAHFLALLLAFIALCIVPGALWAAAITPVSVAALQLGTIGLPSYSNTTFLQKNHTNRLGLPSEINSKGTFAYNVGETFLGSLLYSASTATTVDGSVRQHAKFDYSRFTYYGRSYGVGASVGLVDDAILLDQLATQYVFQEEGYSPTVMCIYNTSSAFSLSDSADSMIYIASGYLPNSEGQEEWSRYAGFSTNAIVAIGVASSPTTGGRILGIASGAQYPTLNNTQCTIDFQPTLFNVTVDVVNRNITVTPVEASAEITDIEPSGFLKYLATWQFTLISTDQTTLYSSLTGNSINASISNYITSTSNKTNNSFNVTEVTLAGLTNSVTAMIDDILTSYASAQLIVAKDTKTVPVSITDQALRLGEEKYVIAIVIFNAILIFLVVEEAIRTRGWETLMDFNYMDPMTLLVGSSRGGRELAEIVDTTRASREGMTKSCRETVPHSVGDIKILQKGSRIIWYQKLETYF